MEISDEENMQITSEDMLELLNLSGCGILILRLGSQTEMLYANEFIYNLLQYSREEYREKFGNDAMACILPEEKQKIKTLIARQAGYGGNLHLEFRVLRKDGSKGWLELSAKHIIKDNESIYYCTCMDITISKRNLADAFQSKKDLDLIANNIPGGVIKIRMRDLKIIYANDGFFRLSGYSRGEYSMNFQDCCANVIHPKDIEHIRTTVQTAVENHGLLGMEYRIIAKNGETRWSYVNGTRVDDENGDVVYLCVIVDITYRKECEQKLADTAKRSDILTNMLKETQWTYDIDSQTLWRSGNLSNTYSMESEIVMPFQKENVCRFVHPEDVERFMETHATNISTPGKRKSYFRIMNARGGYEWVELCTVSEARNTSRPVKVYGVTRLLPAELKNIAEVSKPQKKEKKYVSEPGHLVQLAATSQADADDVITGLVPYSVFLRKAENILANRKEEDRYAILSADINEFRKYSHHYGFSVGNEILKVFSDALLKNLAEDGLCARVDSDYFVLLVKYEDREQLSQLISDAIKNHERLPLEKNVLRFGSTIGVYHIKKDDNELTAMLEKADQARRSIKGLKGNQFAVYSKDITVRQYKKERLMSQIRKAFKEKRVDICYMPRIHDTKENVIGCKAIPRIQLDNGQYISSHELLHLLQMDGKVTDFGLYILMEVAERVGAWKAMGNKTIPISLEMAAGQLATENAVDKIDHIIKKNNLDPENIILEIPERYFTDSTTAFDLAVIELTRLGYKVVISQFGSDSTAIHTLRRLPIAGIKFHAENFTERMVHGRDGIILKKIVEMADEMGMYVCCGGVHTQLQENFAREIGCHNFEGDFYYCALISNVFEKCFLQ